MAQRKDNDPKFVTRTDTFSGINNVSRPEDLDFSEFTQAENVYVTDRNTVSRRAGVTQILSSNTLHSLGGSPDVGLVVNSGELSLINDDLSLTGIRTGVGDLPMSYQDIGNAIYYSNGIVSGKVVNGSSMEWAVPTPLGLSLTATDGALFAGEYRVTMTAVDQYGEESGAYASTRIVLATTGGIDVTVPEPPVGGSISIYMTPVNSEEFYWVASADAAGTVSISNKVTRGRSLETHLLDPMPAGHIVKYFKGRLLVANDNAFWYSEPFRYGMTKIAYNFYQFRTKITMLEPVEGGIYVSAGATYFLSGSDIAALTQREVAQQPAILGTSIQIDGAKFAKGVDGKVVLWTSEDGIYLGSETGDTKNLTESTVSFPFGDEGAAQFIQADGAAQYISVLREPSDESNKFGVADKVAAEVYRNGILIEV